MTYTVKTRLLQVDPVHPNVEVIKLCAHVLREGGLVAFPTETVYGLGANAEDPNAVNHIFAAKERPASDPLIVHLHDIGQLENIATGIPSLVFKLADQFWPGPLTFVLQRNDKIASNVAAGKSTVAVRMPNHPVALSLLKDAALPVAAPSANRFSRPSATTAQHVMEDLDGRVDIVLDGGATIIGVESTILDLTKKSPLILRPGGVTLEALRVFIPEVQQSTRFLRADERGIDAPGMLIKHYSPRASLLLFSGDPDLVIASMKSSATEQINTGKKVGLLLPDSEVGLFREFSAIIYSIAGELTDVSHYLFAGFRSLDASGVDVILAHDFGRTGLGAAIWDRLLRAAEGKVVYC